MADRFPNDEVLLDDPFMEGEAVTANDSVDLIQTTRGLWVGTAGNVHVQMAGYDGSNNEATLVNVQNGTLLNIRVTKVYETGTDATDIVGLY